MNSVSRIKADGVDGVRDSVRPAYYKGLRSMSRFRDSGTPIYERDWDLLIVVDACRLDLMCEVVPNHEFISGIEPFRSLDSMTPKWMEKNFIPEYSQKMSETAYVCGNPFSQQKLDPSEFFILNEVWRDAWVEPGTVPPHAVTDLTIETARERQPNRLIAHYMQPHCPFISRPNLTEGQQIDNFIGYDESDDVWDKLRKGELTREEVWAGYRENLELALDEISVLLNNIDAETAVITSDHGNALGEWQIYGHPMGMPLDCLRLVPWIEITAVDRETREPETTFETDSTDRKEKLAALGYV